jgi:hypothetical protein
MKMSLTALACLGAFAIAGGAALAQPPPPERAAAFTKIKADIRDTSPGGDYRLTSGHVDVLKKGMMVRFRLEAAADTDYAIVGACDSKCSEIDFAVFDEKEELIDIDQSGNSPMVLIAASRAKTLTVRIDMVDCEESPCAFGVGIFEKGAEGPLNTKRLLDTAKLFSQ